jgi:hypothetical protein
MAGLPVSRPPLVTGEFQTQKKIRLATPAVADESAHARSPARRAAKQLDHLAGLDRSVESHSGAVQADIFEQPRPADGVMRDLHNLRAQISRAPPPLDQGPCHTGYSTLRRPGPPASRSARLYSPAVLEICTKRSGCPAGAVIVCGSRQKSTAAICWTQETVQNGAQAFLV